MRIYNESIISVEEADTYFEERFGSNRWHDYILNNPAVHIDWLRKGHKFLDSENNEMGVFKNPLALVYFLAY